VTSKAPLGLKSKMGHERFARQMKTQKAPLCIPLVEACDGPRCIEECDVAGSELNVLIILHDPYPASDLKQ